MKYPNIRFSLLIRSFCIPVVALVILGQSKATDNLSLKLEIGRALDKGVTWLNGEQNASSGNWGEPEYPALTGLVLRATLGHPESTLVDKFAKNQKAGFDFILSLIHI